MASSERIIQRLVKEHEQWLEETAIGLMDRAARRLKDNLAEASLPSLRSTDSLMSRFALCYGTKGVVGLYKGQDRAWDDVYLGAAFHLHELSLKITLWSRIADESAPTLPKVACALCFALANGMSNWVRLFSDILVQAESNDDLTPRAYWSKRKFEPFALRLAQIDASNGANVTSEVGCWGVYSSLLENWDSLEAFSKALEAACEYHCKNMEDAGADWEPEFDDSPFDLIPWEILAICQVRRRQGLMMPEVRHPLLMHVATFAPRNELPFDERINAVEQLRRALCMTASS